MKASKIQRRFYVCVKLTEEFWLADALIIHVDIIGYREAFLIIPKAALEPRRNLKGDMRIPLLRDSIGYQRKNALRHWFYEDKWALLKQK